MEIYFKTDELDSKKTSIILELSGMTVTKFIELSSKAIKEQFYPDINGNIKLFFYNHIGERYKIYIEESEQLFTKAYPHYFVIGYYFEFEESPQQIEDPNEI